MLGNDIVDLRDFESRPETFRARFDARVYAPAEREALASSQTPMQTRWALWAGKEAGFKAARQRDPGLVFAPKEFAVQLESEAVPARKSDPNAPGAAVHRRGRAVIPVARAGHDSSSPAGQALVFELECFETDDFVHVIAAPAEASGVRLATRVAEIDPGSVESRSTAVRRLARATLAVRIGVDAARLSIGRRQARIPVLALDGEPLPVHLSLSHHGRFVAFAAATASNETGTWIGGARQSPPPATAGAR